MVTLFISSGHNSYLSSMQCNLGIKDYYEINAMDVILVIELVLYQH